MGARTRTTPEPHPSHTRARTTPEPHPSHLRTICEPFAIDRPMIDRPTERPIGRPAGWSAGRPVGQSGELRGWSIGRSVVGRSVGRSVDRPVGRFAGAHGLFRSIHAVAIIWFPAVKPLPSISPAFRLSAHHICFRCCVRRSTQAVEKPTSSPVQRPVTVFLPSSPKQTSPARTLAPHAGQGRRWALRLDHSAESGERGDAPTGHIYNRDRGIGHIQTSISVIW